MALRCAPAVAVVLVAGAGAAASASAIPPAGAAAACAGSEHEELRALAAVAPACFEQCPEICAPLDRILGEGGAVFDGGTVESVICEDLEPLACLFARAEDCRTVLKSAGRLSELLPGSSGELAGRCGTGAVDVDVQRIAGDDARYSRLPSEKEIASALRALTVRLRGSGVAMAARES